MPRKSRGEVLAVIGAQYGSEGKGVIVHSIANRYNVHIRTGGPNAGHSFYHEHTRHVQQIVPCGWTNPNAMLVIGRGALVNLDLLHREVQRVAEYDPTIWERLIVDEHAGVLDPKFHTIEGGVDGELHQRIGSTGEGVGAARIARLQRDPNNFYHFGDAVSWPEWQHLRPLGHSNTPQVIRDAIEADEDVLLEGTQGSELSLIHGPWPYVTSHDTNAAQLAADAGIPPRLVTRTMLVARTHPIRVAGNSGPLHREITWEKLGQRLNRTVHEQTTVTRKTRRVGEWDAELVDRAVLLNHPTSFAITFLDYLDPADAGVTDWDALSTTSRTFVDYVERSWGVPVRLVGTGGDEWEVIDRDGAL